MAKKKDAGEKPAKAEKKTTAMEAGLVLAGVDARTAKFRVEGLDGVLNQKNVELARGVLPEDFDIQTHRVTASISIVLEVEERGDEGRVRDGNSVTRKFYEAVPDNGE